MADTNICPDCKATRPVPPPGPLDEFCTPIWDIPPDAAEIHRGDCPRVALPPDVARRLDARLRANREARGRALVSAQNYWVG